MIKVIAKLTIKPDSIEAFQSLAAQLFEPTLAEPGCIRYHLYQDQNQATIFIFDEEWQDMEAFNAHLASNHLTRLNPQLEKTFAKEIELNLLNIIK